MSILTARLRAGTSFVLAMALASCGGGGGGSGNVVAPPVAPTPTPTPTPTPPPMQSLTSITKTAVTTFDAPWGLTFLPTGEMLVTERPLNKDASGATLLNPTSPGAMWLVTQAGVKTAIDGLPASNVGILCVALDPQFATNKQVYITYLERDPAAARFGRAAANTAIDPVGLSLFKAKLTTDGTGTHLVGGTTIWRGTKVVSDPGSGEPGGYLTFSPDGAYLFVAVGDRQEFTPVQDLSNTLGKIIRLNPDGTAPATNPFVGTAGAKPEIWTLGHRNPYGLSFDSAGTLWEHEMGPKGGDELNIILPGKNYGWPNVSYGDNYDGSPIPKPAAGDGFEPAQVWWVPVIAPAGMVIYSGNLLSAWKGYAVIGGLQSRGLVLVNLTGARATEATRIDFAARVRALAQAPTGEVWVLGDGPSGNLWKITPAP
ncbi:PQQ-dependent sugar dehydrogenase [uncultured Sphingomonas sp.]|uniref:PQQ-dependent sugar dehydrogenase n=1 Tax=uncultured Sphingomonas sp. TaxID=158754 RepID=UPI0025E60848|nr:PQQ-dependent sugar dehydrogenase [uncultured Sphingomonas sp.]